MSKESRAANKAKRAELTAKYERIRKSQGFWAMFKESWKDTVEDFKSRPLWIKPLYILRNLISIPILVVVALLIVIISFMIGLVGFIVGLYIDYFWRMFAVSCLALSIIVLFVTGVF